MGKGIKLPSGIKKWHLFLAAPAVIVLLVAFYVGSYTVSQYSESTAFCVMCHIMKPEATSHQNSPHARTECGTCHVGPGAWPMVKVKLENARYVVVYPLNLYPRPLETPIKSLRPVKYVCEQCHWPQKLYEDRLTIRNTYAENKTNSLTRTALLMKIGGGPQVEGKGRGIHWHIENPVWYIAADEKRQEIPWVKADFNGVVTEYLSAGSKLTAEQIAKAPKRKMDCVDCHNRATHVFRRPATVLDEALFHGTIPADLPEIKRLGTAALERTYATEEEAGKAIAAVADFYRDRYPDVAKQRAADVKKAVAALQAIFDQTQFPFMKVNWQTHPDHIGHKDFPGCFRCHDGKHMSADKQFIRLECNICHSIPKVAAAGKPLTAIEFPVGHEPESHRSTGWLAEHRFKFDAGCAVCHKVDNPGGTDDSSFCSNSACHGTSWKFIGLKAPEIRKMSKPAAAPSLGAPAPIPHPIGVRTNCKICHAPGKVRPMPRNHSSYKQDLCQSCHKPTLLESAQETVKLPIPGVNANAPATPPIPEAKAPPAAAPPATRGPGSIKHDIAGRENCLMCHNPEGGMKPAPKNHIGRAVAMCQACHKPEPQKGS